MDLLGDLITTPRGNKHILLMMDRCTKFVRVAAMSTIKPIDVAKVFTSDFVFTYGASDSILPGNGPQNADRRINH